MRLVVATVLVLTVAAGTASAGTLYAIRDTDNALITIDTNTLAFNVAGSTGVGTGDFGDLAYAAPTMYWVAGRNNNNLYTIDLNTGQATRVGSHGFGDLFTLGFCTDAPGILYGQSTNQNVYEISMADASATSIGSNSVYPGGYDYNPGTDQLILLEAGGNGAIYQINRSNGAATLVNPGAGWVNDNDIAWDWDQNVYWALDYNGDLYKYDSNWNRTTVLTGLGSYAALEYIPEPSALALLAFGSLIGLRRR